MLDGNEAGPMTMLVPSLYEKHLSCINPDQLFSWIRSRSVWRFPERGCLLYEVRQWAGKDASCMNQGILRIPAIAHACVSHIKAHALPVWGLERFIGLPI